MAPTVLGKRTRSAANADAFSKCNGCSTSDTSLTRSKDSPSNVATRSKRRAQFVILDEAEHENPFVTPRKSVHYGEAMDVDEAAEEKPSAKRGKSARHVAPASRLPLSAPKENSPAKALVALPEKQTPTPSTPRHRDAFAGKVAVTPRHRLIVAGRPLTPRSPHTPGAPRHSAPTIYNEHYTDARQSAKSSRASSRHAPRAKSLAASTSPAHQEPAKARSSMKSVERPRRMGTSGQATSTA
jgi:cell division control protein 6